VHAAFKSLLFLAMGDTISRINHRQDIRSLSAGGILVPGSRSLIAASIVNLLGLPWTRGFFSKDLILERINYSLLRSILILTVFLNVALTYYYTFQFLVFIFKPCALSRFSSVKTRNSLIRSIIMGVLSS
jgi:NADH-quinone oxidoreductase subunit L